jgi:hypothetical protein
MEEVILLNLGICLVFVLNRVEFSPLSLIPKRTTSAKIGFEQRLLLSGRKIMEVSATWLVKDDKCCPCLIGRIFVFILPGPLESWEHLFLFQTVCIKKGSRKPETGFQTQPLCGEQGRRCILLTPSVFLPDRSNAFSAYRQRREAIRSWLSKSIHHPKSEMTDVYRDEMQNRVRFSYSRSPSLHLRFALPRT